MCMLNVFGVITNIVQELSCFSILYSCRIDSPLSSESQSVTQMLVYMKLSAPSKGTDNSKQCLSDNSFFVCGCFEQNL